MYENHLFRTLNPLQLCFTRHAAVDKQKTEKFGSTLLYVNEPWCCSRRTTQLKLQRGNSSELESSVIPVRSPLPAIRAA